LILKAVLIVSHDNRYIDAGCQGKYGVMNM
jgi:hypothetical protein